ncbi:neuropeptide F isoform X2 [Ptiloglossa arizonensis]|uniref:neuropeptide F isoform X2 n=1 Tax=Ptiloglossa arizonensis TaxID=3350558 RepID=UPI003FA05E54
MELCSTTAAKINRESGLAIVEAWNEEQGKKDHTSVARMQSYPNAIYLFLVVFVLGTTIADNEPETTTIPTRPEIISSLEELRKFIDHVGDNYLRNGKARYGKRGDGLSTMSGGNRAWDTVKTMLGVSEQLQQPRFERRKQERSRFLREFESTGDNKHGSRIDDRPCHVLDIVEKYYDDMQ